MTWECLNCGNFNDDAAEDECLKCDLDKVTAQNMVVKKKKSQCPECDHTHKWGVACHCYTIGEEEEEEEEEEAEEEEKEEEDEEEDDALGAKVKNVEPVFAAKVQDDDDGELPTPPFVKKMGYIRCNCMLGVPISKRYNKIPPKIIVGTIKIKQYGDILAALSADADKKPEKLKSKEEEAVIEHMKVVKRMKRFTEMIPQWLAFLAPSQIAPMANANKNFRDATHMYEPYMDVRNLVPWNVYKAHFGAVDAVFLQGHKAYTSGDKRINCSDMYKGETLATVTRDSGKIGRLMHLDGLLYAASSNGSVRNYMLSHNPKAIKLQQTFWDHSRSVNTVMFSLASAGPCRNHGVIGHICYMYTCSEDRYIKVWSVEKAKLVASVTHPQLRRLSLVSMTQSVRHLFCGTTGSTVCVFSKYAECERDDIHSCNTPNANKSYCLQVSLKLPPMRMPSQNLTIVTQVKCCGPNYSFGNLWASDSLGQMTVWWIPDEGLDFVPAKTWRAHQACCNAMETTWRHMVSVGDDRCIIMHDLSTLLPVRIIDVNIWCKDMLQLPDIPRRLKCMHIVENYEEGGQLAVGSNYGELFVCATGREV